MKYKNLSSEHIALWLISMEKKRINNEKKKKIARNYKHQGAHFSVT